MFGRIRKSDDNQVSRKRLFPLLRKSTDSIPSKNSPVDSIMSLQRSFGNQAVQRLFKSGDIQAQLKVGKPGDVYEQEADRTAEKVMSMPDSDVQRQEEEEEVVQSEPISEQISPIVQRQTTEEDEEAMQAMSENETPMQRQEEETVEEE